MPFNFNKLVSLDFNLAFIAVQTRRTSVRFTSVEQLFASSAKLQKNPETTKLFVNREGNVFYVQL